MQTISEVKNLFLNR